MHQYFEYYSLNFDAKVIAQSDSLRFHPNLDYFEKGKKTIKFPAIVCAVRDTTGKLITLHRTYLTMAGNLAHVKNPRKFMPLPTGLTLIGGAIQLGKPLQFNNSSKNGVEVVHANVIGIAERLETALAVFSATRIPTWSTMDGNMLRKFEVPKGIDTVVIWADRYRWGAGQESANFLENKLKKQGIQVHTRSPIIGIPALAESINWSDVLMHYGQFYFPKFHYLRDFILRKKKESQHLYKEVN